MNSVSTQCESLVTISSINNCKGLHNGFNTRLVDLSFSFTDILKFKSNMKSLHRQQAADADGGRARGEPPPCVEHFPSYLVLRHGMSR